LHFLKRLKCYVPQKSEEIGRAPVPLKIIIAGAGIGGLSTAIALAQRGHQVTAFEQVLELSEVWKAKFIDWQDVLLMTH